MPATRSRCPSRASDPDPPGRDSTHTPPIISPRWAARARRNVRCLVGDWAVEEIRWAPRFQKIERNAGTTQTFSKRPIPLPIGKAVGGTTVINSGTCWRAPDKVLNEWTHAYGIEGVDPESMRRYFERVERIVNMRPVPRELWGRNAELTHEGTVKLGYSGGPLMRNITDCHGCGTCAMGCPSNAKQAMHISYLPLAQRAGKIQYFSHDPAVLALKVSRMIFEH